MNNKIECRIVLKDDVLNVKEDLLARAKNLLSTIQKAGKDDIVNIIEFSFEKNTFNIILESKQTRLNQFIVRYKKKLGEEIGKAHKIGIKELLIDNYEYSFDISTEPIKTISVPFVKKVTINMIAAP